MLAFDRENCFGDTRVPNRRRGFLALALIVSSLILADAPQPAQAQYIQQGSKLIGTNGSTDALQGFSVALSADGNTALVGGPFDNGQAGAVWVYTRSGGAWTQQGSKLTVTDNIGNAKFGYSVALSADGNTALIGGPADRSMFGGAAWVFTRSAGVWSEQAKLLATDLATSFGVTVLQGASVALSADGNTAVVGAPQDASLTGAAIGIAVVFTRTGGAWGEQQRIAGATNGMFNHGGAQGTSVALSADGNTAAIGDTGYNNGDPSDGAVWIITRSNGVWSQQGAGLIGTNATSGGSHQGQSVALSADGNTLLEGGPADNGGGASSGAAWVFARSGSAWSQQSGKLFLPASTATLQGQSVALSANGNVGIVGAPGSGPGQVFVYARSGSTWSQQGGSLQGTGGDGGTAQGTAVAVSGDGTTMLEGGDSFNNGAGAAWFFRRSVNTHDFNDDGMSDIAWRDTGSGTVASWLMSGATAATAAAVTTVATTWSIVGQRDFNGDRDADLLWRDTGGNTAIWFMSGTQISSTASLGNIPNTWSVAGTADFDGDGKGDILWRDSSGNTAIWLMNGATVANSAGFGIVPSTWTVLGTGDFNGDGFADILWRDNQGNVAIWFMNGVTLTSAAPIGNVPTSWLMVNTGDFNGDAKSDIVWRNGSGDVAIWLMNGASPSSAAVIANVPAPLWAIVQTGDYDGNGTSDLLWRDTNGNTAIWFMNGTTVASTAVVGNIPTIWTVQSAGAE
jgi:VCBS repeat protein/FG-GAP repeat protein